MQLRGNWNYPTAIRFGAGRIAELPEAVRSAGIARPLLVTDPRLAGMAMTMSALDALRAAGLPCAVFSEVRPNPVAANVEAGVKVLREGRHDGVVAFGGGSALDVGKVVAFMAGQTRPMWDFEDVGDWWARADPGGPAPPGPPARRSSRCRRPPAQVPRSAAPASSPTRRPTRRRSSSIR